METLIGFGSIGILATGFIIGLKHALDADHLVAIGTMVTEDRSPWGLAVLGGTWGLGHTLSLVAVGLLVLFLNLQISESTEQMLEGFVGIMLIGLGLNVLRKMLKGTKTHTHQHSHGEHDHSHPHVHGTESDNKAWHHSAKVSPRALAIGLVHGLAGSAGLMLLVIPTIDSKALGILYIAVFGVGSIGGMMIMSFLIGLPFHLTSKNLEPLNKGLQVVASAASILIGAIIVYEMIGE
jgi:ABC-type nickel/cobalt efflux system permease component RcnA